MPSRNLRAASRLLAALVLLASGAPALAWGPAAHRAAASVAEAGLCAPARAAVRDLLGTETLAEASVWPDTVRRTEAWAHTADWHYADIGDDEPVAGIWRGDRGRLFLALQDQLALLADPAAGRGERRTALRFVAHLVVDAHQPLHVGRPGDRGGNEVEVRLGDRTTNLHQAWDSGLLGRMRLGWEDLARLLEAQAAPGLVVAGGGFEDWAEESRAVRPWVYDFAPGDGPRRLTRRYEATARQLALVRLGQAAARLQGTLEAVWCPARPDKAENKPEESAPSR